MQEKDPANAWFYDGQNTEDCVFFLKFNYYYLPLTYSSFSLENVYIWGFFKNCLGFDTVYCITHIYVKM